MPGLDTVLHGGQSSGQLYLVFGNPGAGKTTLASQFLLEGVGQGETCLYATLSETAAEVSGSAASHGWALEGLDILELAPGKQGRDGSADLGSSFEMRLPAVVAGATSDEEVQPR